MELERLIIDFVLNQLNSAHWEERNGVRRVDVAELKVNLMTALKLIDNLSPWDAEKALKVMFGGETDAE